MAVINQRPVLCRFTTGVGHAAKHGTGGWVGPKAVLDALQKREVSCPCRESNHDSSVVAQYYRTLKSSRSSSAAADYAIQLLRIHFLKYYFFRERIVMLQTMLKQNNFNVMDMFKEWKREGCQKKL
jgi:hypothetical protein